MVVSLFCPTLKIFTGSMIPRVRQYGKREPNYGVDANGALAEYATEVFYLGREINGFVAAELAKLYNKLRSGIVH